MKTARQLRELRAQKLEAATAITNAAELAKRDLEEAEVTQFNAIDAEIRALDEQIKTADAIEKRKAEAAAVAGAPVNTGFSEKEVRDFGKFNLVRGLQLMQRGLPLDGLEKEVHELGVRDANANGVHPEGFAVPAFISSEQRGQTATGQTSASGDQGGVTVATELNSLIEAVWQKSFLSAVGATRLAGLQGNQDFMVQDTVPTIASLTEIEDITPGEMTFSKFSMTPNRRGASIPFSKQLFIQSSIDVQALILKNLTMGLDYKLNVDAAAAIAAAVVSGNNNLLALGANGDVPTYDSVVSLEALIESFETNGGALRYLTNSKVKAKLKRTQQFSSTNGDAVYKNGQINEYPAVISNIIPSNLTKGTTSGTCSSLYFGDFSYLYVGMWGGADFVVDNLTKAGSHQVVVTTNMFWNTKVARAKSFAGIKDIVTT